MKLALILGNIFYKYKNLFNHCQKINQVRNNIVCVARLDFIYCSALRSDRCSDIYYIFANKKKSEFYVIFCGYVQTNVLNFFFFYGTDIECYYFYFVLLLMIVAATLKIFYTYQIFYQILFNWLLFAKGNLANASQWIEIIWSTLIDQELIFVKYILFHSYYKHTISPQLLPL